MIDRLFILDLNWIFWTFHNRTTSQHQVETNWKNSFLDMIKISQWIIYTLCYNEVFDLNRFFLDNNLIYLLQHNVKIASALLKKSKFSF